MKQQDLNIQTVKIDDLIPSTYNPRKGEEPRL